MLIIVKNGNRFWYDANGKLHRIDGPAIEYVNGTKCWYLDNNRHRVDGPACEYINGCKFWYLNGKSYTEEEYRKKVGGIC